ncbi:hypothetical protein ACFXDE_17515 [Kitasatospora sp. NPDC059408]
MAYIIVNAANLRYAIVCSFSPVPAGWVVASSQGASNCVGSGIAYTIRKA